VSPVGSEPSGIRTQWDPNPVGSEHTCPRPFHLELQHATLSCVFPVDVVDLTWLTVHHHKNHLIYVAEGDGITIYPGGDESNPMVVPLKVGRP
jgi:hypothetical protein